MKPENLHPPRRELIVNEGSETRGRIGLSQLQSAFASSQIPSKRPKLNQEHS